MNTHEQEDRDYEAGCATELQNALALSQIERPLQNDQRKINALIAQGRFVVYTSHAVYCPRTDAILGCDTVLVSDHGTQEEAYEAAEALGESCEDYSVIVVDPRPAAPVTVEAVDSDEIPF